MQSLCFDYQQREGGKEKEEEEEKEREIRK